jgi:molybdopterin/thiamine biosynthesis adenylyltransferase
MRTELRIPRRIYELMKADLARPHAHAPERVGFCRVMEGNRDGDTLLLLVKDYFPVEDENYVKSGSRFIAEIDEHAIRRARQTALSTGEGIFHVHLHDIPGPIGFSTVDMQSIPAVVRSLTYSNGKTHGMLVLDHTKATALAQRRNSNLTAVDRISVVGQPTEVLSELVQFDGGERFSRQTFLGADAPQQINSLRTAIIGISGGGSHVCQQAGHIGFAKFRLFDSQQIDESNLNRLVGATEEDVAREAFKVDIGARVICSVNAKAQVETIKKCWQDQACDLKTSDVAIGCLDRLDERSQLEAACRRYLIPYVDIGMDVTTLPGHPPRSAGQVFLSLPGSPCMHCCGLITQEDLAQEKPNYGDAGIAPQVVWPNGILASSAIGLLVDLATNWTKEQPGLIYLRYDGNKGTLVMDRRIDALRKIVCQHYPLDAVGDVF